MEISIADQIALDDALVAPADRLKIGKCNLRLSSDVTSKEATLQVVYDVLKLTPFYKAFQVTADAPEIYMQEFWASAYVHNRSVRFKMNNKKHILGLDQFRDILQICPKVGNKKFEEPPLEKEILAFLASLGHSGEIRKITDVNVNKLHQPWRSFAAIINKCLSGKPSYDSLRLSQAQILWGMYNKKNVDYAYLLWEDFIYQIETRIRRRQCDFILPSHVSSSDEEDSDNEVEGMDVKGENLDEDATYIEDQGNEADIDTNANLEGRDDVMTDVVVPQVQVTQEIEDTYVTLTPVNPDGQQQSSSISFGFVSNMLNPNQDTSVDAIFGHNAEATSLVDIPVTAIAAIILCTNQLSSNNESSLHSITITTNPNTGYYSQGYYFIIFLLWNEKYQGTSKSEVSNSHLNIEKLVNEQLDVEVMGKIGLDQPDRPPISSAMRKAISVVPNSQGRHVIRFITSYNDLRVTYVVAYERPSIGCWKSISIKNLTLTKPALALESIALRDQNEVSAFRLFGANVKKQMQEL
ncbi:hypothetical protein Tco_0812688 [Tanacetum coccineum]